MKQEFRLDPKSSEPLYRQLAGILRDQIILGAIAPGEKLPSESEMLSAFHVGRLTVRNALALLVSEGLLTKSQGKGTFCAEKKVSSRALDIEVLLDMSDAYFIPYYVHGISEVLSESGSNFLISDTKDSDETLCSLLEGINARGSAGILLQYTGPGKEPRDSARFLRFLELLSAKGLPVLLLDGSVEGASVSSLTVDEKGGGRRAAEHFAAFGHRKSAIISREDHRDSRLRAEGFLEGAALFSMEEPVKIDADSLWEEELLKAVREGVTAVFAYNDPTAVGAIRKLKKEGYRVPEDVSVIGFDDTYLAASSDPPLTCLSHPKETIGKDAAELLLQMIRDGHTSPVSRIYPVTLSIRESCGRCPER